MVYLQIYVVYDICLLIYDIGNPFVDMLIGFNDHRSIERWTNNYIILLLMVYDRVFNWCFWIQLWDYQQILNIFVFCMQNTQCCS